MQTLTLPLGLDQDQRLDFSLPDFTRQSWVHARARALHEERIRRVSAAWLRIEWLAVADGMRRCALTNATPEELIQLSGEAAAWGLNVLPLTTIAATPYGYASTTARARPGAPYVYRVVVGQPADVTAFKAAYDASDDATIGGLLGFPTCCLDFFRRVWVGERHVDTTWAMAKRSQPTAAGERVLEVDGPPHANILWRWMGVRAVPHLPCSFRCAETATLGERFEGIGREHGFGTEMDWLLDILSWPVEWSGLHGIAEIRTPLLKVSTRTDATRGRHVVRYRGTGYPEEGASGKAFPYRVTHRPVAETKAFRRGIENPIEAPDPGRASAFLPAWFATDNGFSSVPALEEAHRPIVEAVVAALGTDGGNVLDLGCGNGRLLRAIRERCPTVVPYGVEYHTERVLHARQLLPEFALHFVAGDLFDVTDPWTAGRRYALAILMPGRLLETGAERAAQFRERLAAACDRVLVYAYGDWLTRHGDLENLTRLAGLRPVSFNAERTVGLATV